MEPKAIKKEMSGFRMIATVTLVAAISAFLLSFVNGMTKERVMQSINQEKLSSFTEMFGNFDNNPIKEAKKANYKGKEVVVYPIKQNGIKKGMVVEIYTMKGYGGKIIALVGVNKKGVIPDNGVKILEQKETPGLGNKASKPQFLGQFNKKGLDNFKFGIKKEGEGDVVAITSATISSRAVTQVIKNALLFVKELNQGKIKLNGGL